MKQYRLPDGRMTRSSVDDRMAWERLGRECAAKFGPEWTVLQCDPDVVLVGMATTVRLPLHAARCLTRKA